jgi:hypothetical protein
VNETVTDYQCYLPREQRRRAKHIAKQRSVVERALRKQVKRLMGKVMSKAVPAPAYEPISAMFHHGRTWPVGSADLEGVIGNGFE